MADPIRMNERMIARADRDWQWVNWYISRGHLYGSGRMLRSLMRQNSWRRKL